MEEAVYHADMTDMTLSVRDKTRRIVVKLNLERDADLGLVQKAKSNGQVILKLGSSNIPMSVRDIGYKKEPRVVLSADMSALEDRGLTTHDVQEAGLSIRVEVDPQLPFDEPSKAKRDEIDALFDPPEAHDDFGADADLTDEDDPLPGRDAGFGD